MPIPRPQVLDNQGASLSNPPVTNACRSLNGKPAWQVGGLWGRASPEGTEGLRDRDFHSSPSDRSNFCLGGPVQNIMGCRLILGSLVGPGQWKGPWRPHFLSRLCCPLVE